jgi:hypothetical protein
MPDRELVDVVAFLVVSMLIVVRVYSECVGRRNVQGTSLISQRSTSHLGRLGLLVPLSRLRCPYPTTPILIHSLRLASTKSFARDEGYGKRSFTV